MPPTNTNSKPAPTEKVKAGPCRRNPDHPNTQIYRTVGEVRYCKCNDCGETWQTTGQDDAEQKSRTTEADREFLKTAADLLDGAKRIQSFDGASGIEITPDLLQHITVRLREIAAA